jgi:DNA-binding beta-propeller fold protein YncE
VHETADPDPHRDVVRITFPGDNVDERNILRSMIRYIVFLVAALLGTPQPSVVADAPSIVHVGVDRLRAGEDLVVEATVTGARPIARVSVSSQVGDRFGDTAFERAGPATWRARVPGARLDRDFAYIIHASDEGGRVSTWPSVASGAPGHRVTVAGAARTERHLLYVTVPGVRNYVEYGGVGVIVYDIANGHRFVKRIPVFDVKDGVAPENIKGVALSAQSDVLYVTTPRRMAALDLKTERVLWNREYDGGCDRMAISPDGRILYVPSLEGPHWHVVDARTGDVIKRIDTDSGAHNTIYGPDGAFVYLAGLRSPLLHVADAATHTVTKRVGPFGSMIRPFTINGRQTLCFVNINNLLGFEVGDLRTGKMLHRVEVRGYEQAPVKRHGCPSHGIALTPDESELWLADAANSRVHIFDATSMPPKQVASIRVRDQPGWIAFSLDGRYGYPSTGDIIDTRTRQIIGGLTDERGRAVQSEKMVDAMYSGDRLVRAGDQFGIGRRR